MFPKVKFVLAKESFDSDLLLDFSGPISGGWDWSKIIFDSHPKLAKYIKNVDEEEKEMIIKKYTSQFRKDNYEELQSKVKLFQKQWDKVNDDYMETLQEVIEINWPKSKKIIGYITICPICPRFLETWSFAIYYKTKISEVNLIVAHETLHFIYFKKWKEVFPKSDPKTFDSPHLEWHLSEILATVILNNTPELTFFKITAVSLLINQDILRVEHVPTQHRSLSGFRNNYYVLLPLLCLKERSFPWLLLLRNTLTRLLYL